MARETKGRITPEFERTRSLSDLFVPGQQPESAYARTLLLAMEWAEEELARLLGNAT